MKRPDYSAIIPYKVLDIVSLIIENQKLKFIEALDYLYASLLYDMLSKEETKIWYLSNYKLFDMLEEEKRTKKLELPDLV